MWLTLLLWETCEDRGCRVEDAGWKMEDEWWKMKDGGWIRDGFARKRLQFSESILRWQGCSLLEAEPWGWLVCNPKGRKVFQKNYHLFCKAGWALQDRKRSESKLAILIRNVPALKYSGHYKCVTPFELLYTSEWADGEWSSAAGIPPCLCKPVLDACPILGWVPQWILCHPKAFPALVGRDSTFSSLAVAIKPNMLQNRWH